MDKKNWKYILIAILMAVGIIAIPFILVMGVIPGGEKEDVKKYVDVANELGLDWHQLVAFDMSRFDNEIAGKDPNDAAYYFLTLQYSRYQNKTTCIKKDAKGKCLEKTTEPVVVESRTIKGKSAIKSFLESKNARGDSLFQKIQSLNSANQNVTIIPIYIDEAMQLANFNDEQKQRAQTVIDSGVLDEMFPDFASMSIGPGGCVGSVSPNGIAVVNAKVKSYEPLIKKYAKQFGVEQYVQLFEAIMMNESGGNGTDPMQASEGSYGNVDPNCIGKSGPSRVGCIRDPEKSIIAGVQEAKYTLQSANYDILIALQTYNYGPNFATWMKSHGGHYTLELSQEYQRTVMAQSGQGLGTADYALRVVQRYYHDQGCMVGGGINISVAPGSQIFDVNQVMKVMLQFKGYPYHWGGMSPDTSFDCSGLLLYSFRQIGINLPRTASEQYSFTARVDKPLPGDLIFWNTTGGVSHVGIFVGKGADPSNPTNDFFESGGDEGKVGVRFNDSDKSYYKSRLVGYGRITRK